MSNSIFNSTSNSMSNSTSIQTSNILHLLSLYNYCTNKFFAILTHIIYKLLIVF